MTIASLKKKIWDYYKENKRDLPWRNDASPYSIVVSEIMLQQTQVKRVIPKYESFIKKIPNWRSLANATVHDVIGLWKGLGYNRRAVALHTIAKKIIQNDFPSEISELEKLPSIGPNTARSIAAFAFNAPVVFIETNIRTVFIHHFFKNKKNVHDDELIPLIKKSLPKSIERRKKGIYREWYWALMDYGSYLKQTEGNFSRQSKHYTQQTPFKGSNREMRSKILQIIHKKPITEAALIKMLEKTSHSYVKCNPEIIIKNLKNMEKEGFLIQVKKLWKTR